MHDSIIITILLFVLIVIVTFCLVNKHRKNVTEHYDKVSNIRIEDTHHQGLDPKLTAEGKGFTVLPTNNVFENNAFYKIKSKQNEKYFIKLKVLRIDKKAFFKKDIISFKQLHGGMQGKEYSDVVVTKITNTEAHQK